LIFYLGISKHQLLAGQLKTKSLRKADRSYP
jgi:hypothetical protein